MERLRKAVGDQSYKSDGKGCENVTRPYLFCDLRAWKFLSAGMDTRRIFRALRTVDAVARDLFASKRTPFNGNLFQRWKLIEANIVAYHSCDGTESVKHSTDLIWFSDLVSSVGAEKGIFHVLPSELFLKWTVRASGTLRQSSVKATIGQGGAYIEAGEYVGAWAVQRTKPWSFEHANMWRLFGDLKLGTSFPAWEGLHSVNFVDRWPLGRATATFHGRVMHHCYEWRSSQFPCKMQDIARSLAWSVCVIETDRRWRCLAAWNGWTMMNFFAIQLHVKDSRTARVIVQPKTGPFAARACYLPSTSREFEVDIFRLAAFAPFSLFAFPSSSEPWQSAC